MIEDAVDLADAERAEDQNRDGDAGLAQPHAFLDVGAGEHRRAGGLERERDASRAVAVRIGLDDGQDARRRGGGADQRRDRAVVVGEGVEIDAGNGGPPGHAMP